MRCDTQEEIAEREGITQQSVDLVLQEMAALPELVKLVADQTSEIDLPDRSAALWWIIRNQFGRCDLTDYQRAELALKVESVIREKARENKQAGAEKARARITKPLPQLRPAIVPVDARAELAKLAGISDNTMAKVRKIAEKALTRSLDDRRIRKFFPDL